MNIFGLFSNGDLQLIAAGPQQRTEPEYLNHKSQFFVSLAVQLRAPATTTAATATTTKAPTTAATTAAATAAATTKATAAAAA